MSKRLLITMMFLAGCTSSLEYKRPPLPVSASWPEVKGGSAVGSATLVATEWRAVFINPELQGLITAALEHNRDLRLAVARVDEARALAGLARSDRYPSMDFNAQRAASRTPADLSATGRPINAKRYDINLGVSAFELDFWGRVKNLDAAARAAYLSSEEANRAFRAGLIADVVNVWLSRLELGERLALADATVASRERTRFLIGKRRDVGLSGDIDYLQAEGAYQSALAESANLARQKGATENALRLMVGTEVPGVLEPAGKEDGQPPGLQLQSIVEPREGLPSEVLLARPDVRAAEQKLMSAHASIEAARAAFLPKVLLTAAAGTASAGLSRLFAAGSGAWSFVPALRLPLFDAGRNAENLDLAVARKNIAVAEYEKTIQQAFREVADLLAAREHFAAQFAAQLANANAQGDRLKLVEARYNAGVSSHLELLDAQREHFAAQQAVLAARRQQLSTTANLYKALGLL